MIPIVSAERETTSVTTFRAPVRCCDSQRVASRSHAPSELCTITCVNSSPRPNITDNITA